MVSCKALLQADWTALKCSVCRAHFLNLCKATFLPESYNVLEFTPYYVACEFVKHVSKTNLTETKNKYSAFGVRPNILKPKKGEISLNVRIFRLGTRQFVSHRFCFVVLFPLPPSPYIPKFSTTIFICLIFEHCIGLRQYCHEFGSHHGFCFAVSALFAFLQIAPFVSISRLLAPSLLLLPPLLPIGLFCFQRIQHLLTTASATFELRYNNGLSTRCKWMFSAESNIDVSQPTPPLINSWKSMS